MVVYLAWEAGPAPAGGSSGSCLYEASASTDTGVSGRASDFNTDMGAAAHRPDPCAPGRLARYFWRTPAPGGGATSVAGHRTREAQVSTDPSRGASLGWIGPDRLEFCLPIVGAGTRNYPAEPLESAVFGFRYRGRFLYQWHQKFGGLVVRPTLRRCAGLSTAPLGATTPNF